LCPDKRKVFITASKQGSIVALFALVLPVSLLICGMVLDIGVLLGARQIAKAACDLGALAGLQEIDWELLEQGVLALHEEQAIKRAIEFAEENVRGSLANNARFYAQAYVKNGEPCIRVLAEGSVRMSILSIIPQYRTRVPYSTFSEASITLRTKW
jgi:hypothetical protein